MTISFNGTTLTDVFYNGTDCTTVIYNGTTVFSAQRFLYTVGRNNYGQLGLGDITNRSSFTKVGSNAWSACSAGRSECGAIKTDGTLWAWGNNNWGQLGLGNRTNYSSPKQVGSLTNWSKTATAYNWMAAIKTDGTLWTWGRNNYGQLGLGTVGSYTHKSSPTQVGSLTNWSNISVSDRSAAAIKTDGTLWTWGRNNYGQLGLGNTTNYSSPKQVGSLTDWQSVSAGPFSTLAVKTNGTIWTWGLGASGRLGLGNSTNYSSPKQIGSLTNWSGAAGATTASFSTSAAVKTNGTIWVWGRNDGFLLGIGNPDPSVTYSSPMQLGSLTNWKAISFSQGSSQATAHAIKTDNTMWAWGVNGYGTVGDGTTNNRSSPVQVGYGSSWKSTVTGITFAVAITL